jgi:hypothetical protein
MSMRGLVLSGIIASTLVACSERQATTSSDNVASTSPSQASVPRASPPHSQPTPPATPTGLPSPDLTASEMTLLAFVPEELWPRCSHWFGSSLGSISCPLGEDQGPLDDQGAVYVERFGTLEELNSGFTRLFQNLNDPNLSPRCEAIFEVYGDLTVGAQALGQGGGCADDGLFNWTVDEELVLGTMSGDDYVAARDWFVANRPFGDRVGKVSGSALIAPYSSYSFKGLVAAATKIRYRDLARYPDRHINELIYYKAKVFQVASDGALVQVTHTSGGWSDLVWITYPSSARLLDDDIVQVVGLGYGEHTYTTVLGAEKTVPELTVLSIQVVE